LRSRIIIPSFFGGNQGILQDQKSGKISGVLPGGILQIPGVRRDS
jgi:hypothetical protein